jgi:predicted aconitase
MQLTPQEQSIYDGEQGVTLQKVMRSVVAYGDVFAADRLVEIEGLQHMVTSFGANTIRPYFEMIDEIISAGLKTKTAFTVDPRPVDYDTFKPDPIERLAFKFIFGRQKEYEQQLQKLGLKDSNAFSCACYLAEVANQPEFGSLLAWSESSAVVYANSVLGARSNRNSAGIDLMCDILGKAPRFGLLSDEGRQATWLVEVKTSGKPNPHLLGSAIGLKVMEEVPYITGMECLLGGELNQAAKDYFKDMGAAAASNGAVGLYHVEGLTPEAVLKYRDLLASNYKTYVIDDAELERVKNSYPVLWKDVHARPRYVFIGCPHLSRQQIEGWVSHIGQALERAGGRKSRVPAYLFTAPDVLAALKKDKPFYQNMLAMDVHLTTICPLMYMNNPLCARRPIATNSNKLRTYSTARFYPDDEILGLLVGEGGAHAG